MTSLRLPITTILVGAALIALATILTSAPPAAAQTLLLRNATVIDGTDRPAAPQTDVLIRNGWITAVGKNLVAPAGARSVDLTGKFLLPGFIEMHGHLAIGMWEPDTVRGGSALHYPYDDVAAQELTTSQLAFGITTVRNPAGPTAESVALRNRVRQGELVGPRIITAGAPIDRALVSNASETVRTEEEVREAVRRQASAGVDLIKLYSTLDSTLTRAGVDEAHRHGLRAIAHLWRTSWTEAMRAGIDGITHILVSHPSLLPADKRDSYQKGIRNGLFMYDWFGQADFDGPEIQSMLTLARESRITVDPTLVAFEATAWSDDTTFYPAESRRYVPPTLAARAEQMGSNLRMWPEEDYRAARRQFPLMLELARRLHQAGVPLTVGTDGANPWLFHHEMELLVRAGIPAVDVVRMATSNAARDLGLISEIGTVEVGKRAELVVLDADPTSDIRNTRRIAWVLHQGALQHPDAFLPKRLQSR